MCLTCSPFLANMIDAAMNICLQVFGGTYVFISLGCVPRGGIAGSYWSLHFLFQVLPDSSPFCIPNSKVLLCFYRPQRNWRMFQTWRRIMRSTVTQAFRPKGKQTGYVLSRGEGCAPCTFLVSPGSFSQVGPLDLELVLQRRE